MVAALAVAMTMGISEIATAQTRSEPGPCLCQVGPSTVGVFESVSGSVFVLQSVGQVQAQPNATLTTGSTVTTGSQSSAQIALGRNCRVNLRPNSTLVFVPQRGGLCVRVNQQTAGGASGGGGVGPGEVLLGVAGGTTVGLFIYHATRDEGNPVSR